jgi:cytochrome c oxidase assembly factor 2
MPPHLHPRSTATSTLFAGTLLASFTVVAIPHIFPCPRPRRAYADAERQLDSDGRSVRRQRREGDVAKTPRDPLRQDRTLAVATAGVESPLSANPASQDPQRQDEAALFRQFQHEAEMLEKEAHACPIPKPGRVLGRILGLQQDENKQDDERGRRKDTDDVR